MVDPKELELIEEMDEASRKRVKAYRKLWKYQKSNAQQGGKAGG